MKTIIRLPTDQFAYIEQEWDVPMTPDMAVEAYKTLAGAYKGETAGPGLPDKEFNTFLDNYLKNNTGELEVFNRMNEEQKKMIQTLKKAFKRLKYNEIE